MEIMDLGLTGYEKALEIQHELLEKRIHGCIPDTLVITEHYPVVTMGRISPDSGVDQKYFDSMNIPVLLAGRGGKGTYHSPGQLVMYPIMDLKRTKKDVSLYIDFLEKTTLGSLRVLGVPAMRDTRRRGVWCNGRKIAFTGIAVRRWVTFHGVSVNINNDIEPFLHMLPCGEKDIEVTSVKEVIGHDAEMVRVKKIFAERFISDMEREYSRGSVVNIQDKIECR